MNNSYNFYAFHNNTSFYGTLSSDTSDENPADEKRFHPVVTIILASISSSLELFIGLLIGAILAHPRLGILSNSSVRRRLGKALIYVLGPLFHLRNFSLGIDLDMIGDLWILPLWGALQWLWQYIISEILFMRCSNIKNVCILFNEKVVTKIFKKPIKCPKFISFFFCCFCRFEDWIYCSKRREKKKEEEEEENNDLDNLKKKNKDLQVRRMCVFCSGLGNCGFYPMVFVTSLALNSKVFPDPLVEEHSYAFISLYIISHPAFFYSYIFNIMKALSDNIKKKEIEEEEKKNDEEEESNSNSNSNSEESEEEKINIELRHSQKKLSEEEINNPSSQEEEEEEEEGGEEEEEEEESEDDSTTTTIEIEEKKEQISSNNNVVSKTLLNPIVGGMLLGMIIGAIPPLKKNLFEDPLPIIQSFTNVTEKMGNAFLGLAMITVGAGIGTVIFGERPSSSSTKNKNKEKRKILSEKELKKLKKEKEERLRNRNSKERISGVFRRAWKDIKYSLTIKHVPILLIIRSILIKLILFPIISFSLTVVFVFTIGPYVIQDDNIRGLIYVILMVEGGVPCMMTLPMVASIFDFGVDPLAEIMLFQYIIAPITMAVYTVGVLYFVCSIEKCNL